MAKLRGLVLRKKAPIKKKTSIGHGACSKHGSPTREKYPPAGGRKYRKKYRGQGGKR